MATVIDTLVAQIVFKGDTKALDNVNQRLKQFSTNLNAMGRKFGLAGGAITAFSGLSLKSFAGFDDALNQSLAIMEDVSDAMRKDMAQAAKDVALTTRFSAKDAAASYFFLASAGLDAKQSIEALPQVAQFAQAGMFDMAQATDLLTDAQSALGLTVRDDVAANMQNMVRVSDTLVAANQKANATVQQFSEALTNRAGAALRALGKDVEEGVAVLAAYADQGEKGQRAGEQLNIVLRDLQKSVLGNRSAFDQAGVTVFDASGEMANLGEIIGDLEDHLAGLSDEQKRVALTTLGFQERSLSSLITLLGTSDAIRDYEAALRDAAGTTQSVAEKQLQSLSAQFDLLKSHVEVAMIGIGGAIAPLVAFLFGPLSAALSWVSGLFESNNWFARIAAQGVAILGVGFVVLSGVLFGAALAVRGYAFALTSLKIPQMIATLWNSNFIASLRLAAITVRKFVANLSRARVAQLAGAAATGIASAATWTFSAALLANPLTWIVLGIAALIAALVLLVKHWDTVTDALWTAWSWIKSNWPLLVGILLGPFGIVGALVWKFRDQIVGALGTAWSWMKDNWPLLLGILLGPFGIAAALIFKFRDDVVGAFVWIKDQVVAAWEAMVQFIQDKFDQVKDLPGQLLDAIPGGGAIKKASNWFFGQEGGVVPGPTGQPVPAIVHGGEWVLPTDVTRFLEGLGGRTPLPVDNVPIGYPNFPLAPSGGRTIVNHTTVNLDNITVHVERGDADEIAATVGQALRRELQNTVDDFDSTIAR